LLANATVAQLKAQISGDRAAISAQTLLDYTTITSPLTGRTGIRLVDQGNIVHATDATGLVVVTQLHPQPRQFHEILPGLTRLGAQADQIFWCEPPPFVWARGHSQTSRRIEMRLHALYLIGALAVTAIPLSAGAQSLPANEQWTRNAQAVNQPVQKCAPGWV
jgi:multidrug efflux pump subunit AcrA (membrane-fusion protein)